MVQCTQLFTTKEINAIIEKNIFTVFPLSMHLLQKEKNSNTIISYRSQYKVNDRTS